MVAKPPSWPARRIRALVSIRLVSRSDMVRRIVLCLREDVASKGGKGDMRAHEGSGAARHFLSFRVDQTRVGHIDSTLAADPASLRHNRPFGKRLGEKQIEGCGQQKAITDQTIGRVKIGRASGRERVCQYV